ncbi:hypothetical protein ACP3P6_16625 [Enterobacter mori]
MSTANFLPWRQQRRMRCLRFWGVLFIASLLVTLTLGLGLRMNHDVKLRGLQSELAGINAVQQILKTRQRPSAPQQRLRWNLVPSHGNRHWSHSLP